jgi:deoxyribodipyrimidine photo-lyase
MSTAVVWFRRDLRLEDNPALAAALRAHPRVVCVYVHAPREEAPWQPGAASRWWLHHSLHALDAQLSRRGATLVLRQGDTHGELLALLRASDATAVYWNRLYEPAAIARDARLKEALQTAGVQVHSFNAQLLREPWQVRTQQGGPYRVFTPFWRGVRAQLDAQPPLPMPERIPCAPVDEELALDELRLLPRIRWDTGLQGEWQPGESGAQRLLRHFVDQALAHYRDGRDRPDQAFTSRLSPHLHFGEIGPRQLLWALLDPQRTGDFPAMDREAYIRELGWREFSHHLLYHFPYTPQQNLNTQFESFPWAADDRAAIERWQHGRTGVPIVDAGMRQLWHTGWMHNRVRMIVASWLTKNLRQHWLHGARWFWDTLVDADLASNTQGWQWAAGTGADAAPYFRVFNPVTQGLRFDPDGAYVRRWVSELADVAAPLVHQPWRDGELLRRTGYPAPMSDIAASRADALAAYASMRATRA